MTLTRRQLLAGGGILLASAGVGLASRPSLRGLIDTGEQRAQRAVARRLAPAPAGPPSNVTINVDPTRILRPISPLIYGVAHADPDQLLALGAQLNRWGGNPNTRHNWVANAWNTARDWDFRNYGSDSPHANTPGGVADDFIAGNRGVWVETVFTIPAMGWVARNGDNQTQSVGVPGDGAWPISNDSDAIGWYDPTENRRRTSVQSFARKNAPFVYAPESSDSGVFQDEFINHLVQRFGRAEDGGVQYYVIDNEPDLWSSTHTDVHPVQTSYDDTLNTFLEYATAIKAVDPSAKVVGPALSGWTSYFYSARDRSWDSYRTHRDRQSHGDMPFLAWWLDQVRKHDEQSGSRSLDVLDVHYYPQAPGVFGVADDPGSRALRLRSTRSLWDSNYIDESWIGDTVRLIPRMRDWIDQYYPNTKLAIGEWNWGGEKSISGALAIADVLGIFGREGVDMASYWTFPPVDSPAAQAFQLYTQYNGQGQGFGDQALSTTLDASPDYVTAYGSLNSSSGDVLLVVINKRSDADLPGTIKINGAALRNVETYRYASADSAIRLVGTGAVSGAELQATFPAASMSLLRLTRGA